MMTATLCASAASAHETDNFYLPVNRPFADVGAFFDAAHTRAIERTVRRLNAEIDAALRIRDADRRAQRLAELHDPENIVRGVHGSFSDAFTEVLDIEDALRGPWARAMYPDKITANWDANWMYTYVHFPLDPRRLVLLFQSSTVKAYGVYFGTDKLSHFHHMGMFYYDAYRGHRRGGMDHKRAVDALVHTYSKGGPIGESSLLGFFATGVYSNADLAANYAGFKFYLNLTEPVQVKGREVEPLVVRCGVYWRLSTRVRPESGWFGDFVSDHWNEALNPSLYDVTVRGSVKSILQRRAGRIVEFYTTKDNRPSDPAYYDTLMHELGTLYGEPYGHSGEWEKLLSIGTTCMPALAAGTNGGGENAAGENAAGRTPAAPATSSTPFTGRRGRGFY